MADKDRFTVREFAEIHKVPRSTVSLWCRKGFLAGAYQEETPFGDVWYIPAETALEFTDKPPRGRPRASADAAAAGASDND